jgi:hypothetical protein
LKNRLKFLRGHARGAEEENPGKHADCELQSRNHGHSPFSDSSWRLVSELLQRLDQSLKRGSALYNHFRLTVGRQQLGATSPLESFQVTFVFRVKFVSDLMSSGLTILMRRPFVHQ